MFKATPSKGMSEQIAKKKKSRKSKGMFGKQSKPKSKLNLFSKMGQADEEPDGDESMENEE